jgi:hypothetical protein
MLNTCDGQWRDWSSIVLRVNAGWGVEEMGAETPGWRRGSSREAVRLFPQGFTHDDSPGEDE